MDLGTSGDTASGHPKTSSQRGRGPRTLVGYWPPSGCGALFREGQMAWEHRLSDIDPEARTASCLSCGRARIKRRGQGWRCARPLPTPEALPSCPNRGRPGGDPGATGPTSARSERCGFEPEDPCRLDIDHLDNDRTNDRPENSISLCSNCHSLRTYRPTSSGRASELHNLVAKLVGTAPRLGVPGAQAARADPAAAGGRLGRP